MLTKERVLELLEADFKAGKLFWKVTRGKVKQGDQAGSPSIHSGYWHVMLDGKMYRSHRVLWLMYYGEWPKNQIDHIDCNKRNNAITNLRDVTCRENQSNRKRPSLAGTTGVFPKGRGYSAQIQINGKTRYLGTFDTIEAASAAYTKEKNNVYPDNS